MFSTPTVAGDLLFIGSCGGTFYALHKDNGHVLWSYDIRRDGLQTNFHGDPLITDDLVVIGTDGEGVGYIYAFERVSGAVRWKYRVDCDIAAPCGVPNDIVRFGSNVYSVTVGGQLICLDLKRGHLNWSLPGKSSKNASFGGLSPAVAAGWVFLGRLDGSVYALGARHGGIIWKRNIGSPVSTSLVVLGDSIYVGSENGHIYRLNRKTGSVEADFFAKATSWWTLTPTASSLLTFLTHDGDSSLACLDLSLKKVRWNQESSSGWSSARPYLWRGTVLAGNKVGEVLAYSVTDGSLQWSHKFEGVIRSVGSSIEVLYVGTLEGTVYAYIPQPRIPPSPQGASMVSDAVLELYRFFRIGSQH